MLVSSGTSFTLSTSSSTGNFTVYDATSGDSSLVLSKAAVFIADAHLSDSTPRSRVEKDFLNVAKEKLVDVFKIAQAEAGAVVCVGDLFHQWNPRSNEMALVDLFTLYTIVGNHDIPGSDFTKLSISGIGSGKPRIFGTEVLAKNPSYLPGIYPHLRLHGFSHGTSELSAFCSKELNFPTERSQVNIAVVHSNVWDKDSSFTKHYRDLPKHTGLDFVVLGDIHKGFGPVRHNGAIWINPGCMIRRSVAEKDVIPKALIIRPNRSYSLRSLTFTPAPEAFKLQAKRTTEDIGEEFVQSLQSVLANKLLDPLTLIKKIGSLGGFSDEVQQILIDTIRKSSDGSI